MSTILCENQLLGNALEANDTAFFARNGITREWFTELPEAFDLFEQYIREFNEVPSDSTIKEHEVTRRVNGKEVTAKLVEWGYDDTVSLDSVGVVRARLANILAKREIEDRYAKMNTDSLSALQIADLAADIARDVTKKWGVAPESATNWRTNGRDRFETYRNRRDNKLLLIPLSSAALNMALTGNPDGALVRGDYIIWYGMPKAAKSTTARAEITLPAARAGYRVLDLALENERFEIETLLDSMESAHQGAVSATVSGMGAGFNRSAISYGYLNESEEREYLAWTQRFSEQGETDGYGDYIIKTFEDSDMDRADLRKIESLIDEHKPDVVLIDQLSLCAFPPVQDRKNGGAAEAFSKSLRRMAARKQVVIVLVVQATYEDRTDAETGEYELRVPSLEDVKSTKAVIEDGVVTFGVDSYVNKETGVGQARIGVMMSRKGGAGTEVDLFFAPKFGIVRDFDDEVRLQQEAAKSMALM